MLAGERAARGERGSRRRADAERALREVDVGGVTTQSVRSAYADALLYPATPAAPRESAATG